MHIHYYNYIYIYIYIHIYIYIEQEAQLSPFVDDADAFPGTYILHLLYMIHAYIIAGGAAFALCRRR